MTKDRFDLERANRLYRKGLGTMRWWTETRGSVEVIETVPWPSYLTTERRSLLKEEFPLEDEGKGFVKVVKF